MSSTGRDFSRRRSRGDPERHGGVPEIMRPEPLVALRCALVDLHELPEARGHARRIPHATPPKLRADVAALWCREHEHVVVYGLEMAREGVGCNTGEWHSAEPCPCLRRVHYLTPAHR